MPQESVTFKYAETLNAMRVMLEQAYRVPVAFRDVVRVDREAMLALIDNLQAQLPQEIVQACQLLNNQRLLVSEANAQVMEATNRANLCLSEADKKAETIIDQAQLQANNTIDSANQQAQTIIDEAQGQAQVIVDNAIDEQDRLIMQETVYSEAVNKANEIIGSAYESADSIKNEADSYYAEKSIEADNYARNVLLWIHDTVVDITDRLNENIQNTSGMLCEKADSALNEVIEALGKVPVHYNTGYGRGYVSRTGRQKPQNDEESAEDDDYGY